MTLQQLKYLIFIADSGSLSKAAELAYISQPSLSSSLKEIETELGISLFTRTNRGLRLTVDGYDFLSYARQVVEQYNLIEDKYIKKQKLKKKFNISTQHYSFAVSAFVELVKHNNMEEYEFAIHETKTYEVIDDVRHMRSELGILYLYQFNESILSKIFTDYGLEFHKLFSCDVFVYLWKGHPLAKQEQITLDELQDYPHLSFEQGTYNSFYFAEEVLSTYAYRQSIKVSDRSTMLNLMKGLNAYTLCSGIISHHLNGTDFIAVPFDSTERIKLGYIKRKSIALTSLATQYLEEIKKAGTKL